MIPEAVNLANGLSIVISMVAWATVVVQVGITLTVSAQTVVEQGFS